jgi:predicted ABC-type ATPase
LAGELRWKLIEQGESFIFETVFSDPVGDKIGFLRAAELRGFTVVLFFIGIDGPGISEERVAMRVSKGGHDVPTGKIAERYPRIMKNLSRALRELSNVRVYDNSDVKMPYQLVATREDGREIILQGPVPAWLRALLP